MREFPDDGEDKVKQEILKVHHAFWQALADRDVDTRFYYCADCVTFIGTGLNEKADIIENLRNAPDFALVTQESMPVPLMFLCCLDIQTMSTRFWLVTQKI